MPHRIDALKQALERNGYGKEGAAALCLLDQVFGEDADTRVGYYSLDHIGKNGQHPLLYFSWDESATDKSERSCCMAVGIAKLEESGFVVQEVHHGPLNQKEKASE